MMLLQALRFPVKSLRSLIDVHNEYHSEDDSCMFGSYRMGMVKNAGQLGSKWETLPR
jgi:hypothetical protein